MCFKNLLKSKAGKCQLLASSIENIFIIVNEYDVRESEYEKMIGVKFNTNVSLENHISDICSKTSQKIFVLARIVL